MLNEFKSHIEQHFSFLKNKKLLVGVSGGIDSVVLSFLLSKLNFDITLAHCNFKLRGNESDEDEEFVKNLTYTSSKQTLTTSFDTKNHAKSHRVSIQIAARELRYAWFQQISDKHKFDFILTAHNSDDNLETFLINLTRGSGLEGFTGIPEVNGNIARPLLRFSREEILSFAKENNIQWREDSSNASTKYVRNKIRHEVIPTLKEINPQLLNSFGDTLNYLGQAREIIQDRIEEVKGKVFSTEAIGENSVQKISIAGLKKLSSPQAYLYEILKSYGFTAWDDIFNLLESQSGKQVFSISHRLLKDREFLLLSEISESKDRENEFKIQINQTELTRPIHLVIEHAARLQPTNLASILVDKDLLKYPLIVRKWKNGDYFYPTGMQGKKKVSKYFKDEKFSLIEKDNTWILADAEDEVIWVINHRQDRRYISSNQSKNIIRISCGEI